MQIKKALLHRFGCDNAYYKSTTFEFKADKGGLICFIVCTCNDSIKISYNKKWSLSNFYRHINQKHDEYENPKKSNPATSISIMDKFVIKGLDKSSGGNTMNPTASTSSNISPENMDEAVYGFEDAEVSESSYQSGTETVCETGDSLDAVVTNFFQIVNDHDNAQDNPKSRPKRSAKKSKISKTGN